MKTSPKIIFFGNGLLSEYVLDVLKPHFNIIFHAKSKSDLKTAEKLKRDYPDASAVLASFGVLIPKSFLDLWEPEGILNIHPSLLPKYRGPSPIETAILNGDKTFSVSIMKLTKAMDAGPIYYQETLPASALSESPSTSKTSPPPPDALSTETLPSKTTIYRALASAGANWLVNNLNRLPTPKPQVGTPTFTKRLDKSLSLLDPEHKTAAELLNEIRAFSSFPKSKYTFSDLDCTLLSAHLSPDGDRIVDRLQPPSRKPMDAKSFINGYLKDQNLSELRITCKK